jgi:N-acetylglucosamine-6-phosphate deacetylase
MIIDTHTHGIGGYDTRSSDPEHLLRIADIHGLHGVDEVVLTVYPATIKVMRENMAMIKLAMSMQRSGDMPMRSEFFTSQCGPPDHGPARITGIHLEGPFLNPSMCGSLNAMVLIDPDERNFDELVEGFEDVIRIMTIAPELSGASRIIKRAADKGIISSMGHSHASFSETEAGHMAGAKGITHLFNAMRPYHHREPGLVGYGLLNRDIYIEVIADPFHLHPSTLELVFRAKNHDRIIIISDSIKETLPAPPILGIHAITDGHGRLLGGALPITDAIASLSDRYDPRMLEQFVTDNPERYLAA